VDLFVRVSNSVAVDMYHRLGYIIYRKVIDYYSGDVDEDAYGKQKLCEQQVVNESNFSLHACSHCELFPMIMLIVFLHVYLSSVS